MAVPPAGSSRPTAAVASARLRAVAGTRPGSGGYTIVACARPQTTANGTPSGSVLIAAVVARFASTILLGGSDIDPEQSTMMIWARDRLTGGAAALAAPA